MSRRHGAHGHSARDEGADRLARGLGWFSVGLGLAQAIAPRQVARLIGVRHDDEDDGGAMRGLGARELATGVGILASRRPSGWLFGRVAGDAMDLALLERARRVEGVHHGRVRAAMAAVAGITLLDAYAAQRLSRASEGELRQVKQAITIRRPRHEVYAFWRRFENLPRFMRHIDGVKELDEQRSRWRVLGPGGVTVEWDAEIVDDRPGEHISWRSAAHADVENAGSVYFVDAPKGRGTEVYLDLYYAPPAGRVGVALATLFGREPKQQARDDLRRLKQVLETGQVVHSDASVKRGLHPARPARGALRSDDETLSPTMPFPTEEGEPFGEEEPR